MVPSFAHINSWTGLCGVFGGVVTGDTLGTLVIVLGSRQHNSISSFSLLFKLSMTCGHACIGYSGHKICEFRSNSVLRWFRESKGCSYSPICLKLSCGKRGLFLENIVFIHILPDYKDLEVYKENRATKIAPLRFVEWYERMEQGFHYCCRSRQKLTNSAKCRFPLSACRWDYFVDLPQQHVGCFVFYLPS